MSEGPYEVRKSVGQPGTWYWRCMHEAGDGQTGTSPSEDAAHAEAQRHLEAEHAGS
jgi:hypothetical protein